MIMKKYLLAIALCSSSLYANVYFYPFDRLPYIERNFYNIKYMCSEKWEADSYDVVFLNSFISKGTVFSKFDSQSVRVLIELYDKAVYIDSHGIASIDLSSGKKVDISSFMKYRDSIVSKIIPCREWREY